MLMTVTLNEDPAQGRRPSHNPYFESGGTQPGSPESPGLRKFGPNPLFLSNNSAMSAGPFPSACGRSPENSRDSVPPN